MSKNKLLKVLDEFFKQENVNALFKKTYDIDMKLSLLPSESMLALMLVTSIEDEFNIEFEDDEIDLDFFSSVNIINERIKNQLKK